MLYICYRPDHGFTNKALTMKGLLNRFPHNKTIIHPTQLLRPNVSSKDVLFVYLEEGDEEFIKSLETIRDNVGCKIYAYESTPLKNKYDVTRIYTPNDFLLSSFLSDTVIFNCKKVDIAKKVKDNCLIYNDIKTILDNPEIKWNAFFDFAPEENVIKHDQNTYLIHCYNSWINYEMFNKSQYYYDDKNKFITPRLIIAIYSFCLCLVPEELHKTLNNLNICNFECAELKNINKLDRNLYIIEDGLKENKKKMIEYLANESIKAEKMLESEIPSFK